MMAEREDLSYEKKETKTPYIFTEAKDMDEALKIAHFAIEDAKSFWGHAKATGCYAPKTEPEPAPNPKPRIDPWGIVLSFVAGFLLCLLLAITGVL
ncbi:hypothetical protein [Enorma massiliensis]|uniref:hypothetical protein n=1 Tax=Enorma massiliensis TaxID=1472761 RepID=UPI003A8E7899